MKYSFGVSENGVLKINCVSEIMHITEEWRKLCIARSLYSSPKNQNDQIEQEDEIHWTCKQILKKETRRENGS